MTNFPNTIKALPFWRSMSTALDRFDLSMVETTEEFLKWERFEKLNDSILRDAFYEDTKEFNNRDQIEHAPIKHIIQIVEKEDK